MIEIWDFLKGWGSLIVAALALSQPWCISIWKKLFRPGKITLYETGKIEIGYSNYGPTIGLMGAIRAHDRDQFIGDILLRVSKLKDQSVHDFSWVFFRERAVTHGQATGTGENLELKAPFGFMAKRENPTNFDILFNDKNVFEEVQERLKKVQELWNAKLLENKVYGNQNTDAEALQKASELFQTMGSEHLVHEATKDLDRLNYWDKGKYRLRIEVQTAEPDRVFTKEFSFSLTRNDLADLRKNTTLTILDVCAQPLASYYFSYVSYEK